MHVRTAVRRYVIVAFVVTWACWIPVTLATYGLVDFVQPYPRHWFSDFMTGKPLTLSHWLILCGGMLGPAVGAVAGWYALAWGDGLCALFRGLTDWRRPGVLGYLCGLLPVVYFALAALIVFLISGVTFHAEGWPGRFLLTLLMLCVMMIGEEVGWRGTQLPMLQEKHSALVATVIVGLTWAAWHIPLMMASFLPESGGVQGLGVALGRTLILYPLMTIPMAFIATFAFNSARGFIPVLILVHALHDHLNASLVPDKASPKALALASQWADVVLLGVFWLFLAVILLVFKGRHLSWRPRVTASGMLVKREY